MMRVISVPAREKRGPRPPSWLRTWWMRVGTRVEHNGRVWEKCVVGAADQTWRQWCLADLDSRCKADARDN